MLRCLVALVLPFIVLVDGSGVQRLRRRAMCLRVHVRPVRVWDQVTRGDTPEGRMRVSLQWRPTCSSPAERLPSVPPPPLPRALPLSPYLSRLPFSLLSSPPLLPPTLQLRLYPFVSFNSFILSVSLVSFILSLSSLPFYALYLVYF